ncbi:MAG TPA: TonB-dependent receptor [Syntrophobacteraceae bacterium]|nr:TonB-dependent receptor [Syntrophobacteraceae bacterium]
MKCCWIILTLSILILFASPCPAQEASPPASGDQKATDYGSAAQLDEIVVTASKLPQTAGNVTQKVDIISEKKLDEIVLENRNLAEALQYEPGIFINVLSRKDANWGSYGGLGTKYNTYLLDGLPIDSFVDPAALDPWALARIETQKGPASVLYPNYLSQDFAGNQSPLAGTTNFILKERTEDPQTRASLDYGSYNTVTGHGVGRYRVGNLHFYVGGFGEMSDYTQFGTEGSWLQTVQKPAYNQEKVYGRATYYFGGAENHKLSIFANQMWHDGDMGRPNRPYDYAYSIANANYTNEINNNLTLQVKGGYRNYDRSWGEDNYPASLSSQSNNGVEQNIVPLDASLSIKHFGNNLLTIGSDFQYGTYQTYSTPVGGNRSIGNDANAYQSGIYLQEEYYWESWIFRAGGRYNMSWQNYSLIGGSTPGVSSKSWDKPIWSAGLRYNFTEDLSAYGNAGSSFVVPGIKAVGGTLSPQDFGVPGKNGQIANPNLSPETGLGSDLGIDYQLFKNVKLGVRGFANFLDNAIVTNEVSVNPSQSMDVNAGGATSYGVEFEIKHRLLPWLQWFGNYTYTHARLSNSNKPDSDDVEIPFVPAQMGNVGVIVEFPKNFTGSLYVHIAGTIYDSDSRSTRVKFDPYEVLNMKLTKVLTQTDKHYLDLHLDLYNLTNNRYKMPWAFENAGFSAAGGMEFRF